MGQLEVLNYLEDKNYFVDIKEVDTAIGGRTNTHSARKLHKNGEVIRIKVKRDQWWEYRYMTKENYDKLPLEEREEYEQYRE